MTKHWVLIIEGASNLFIDLCIAISGVKKGLAFPG